jgi:hypothetical protein
LGRRGAGCLNARKHDPPADWVALAEHARKIGRPERTVRRQLSALHARLGGGVLRSYNQPGTRVRKWFVNLLAVRAGLAHDRLEPEEAIGDLLLRVEDLEKKSEALRQSHKALKRHVKEVEGRISS